MNRTLTLATIFILATPGNAQHPTMVTGTVRDSVSREPLQFAIIRIEGTKKGTTTDKIGRFSLYLDEGNYTAVVSQLGYRSVRRALEVGSNPVDLSCELYPTPIELPEMVVTPGGNPALEIIRLAIEHKQKRKDKLENYSLTSHSKVVVKISEMRGIAIDEVEDTALTVIAETQTDAYWAKPDKYKEVVKARKQTTLIPAQSNILISAFLITDFSNDLLELNNRDRIIGPISEAGLRNYDYTLTGTTKVDEMKIFIINISPQSDSDPLLKGTICIAEGSYALTSVDVELTSAALPDFFKALRYKQNFRLFDNEFWMPVDVVVSAALEFSMIVHAKLKLDALSVLQDYSINTPLNEDVFDRTRIKVLSEADTRDTIYWTQHQAIPNTADEIEEYRKSDSLKVVFEETRNEYRLPNLLVGKRLHCDRTQLQLPGMFDIYKFNRVEGHSAFLPLSVTSRQAPRWTASAFAGYGFSDKRWKFSAEATADLLRARQLSVGGSLFNRLGRIDEDEDVKTLSSTTLTNLFFKYDEKDYYYVKGWTASVRSDVAMMFPTSVTFKWQTYSNASRKTNWSVVRPSWPYRDNPPINEGTITTLGASLGFDGREVIDNAGEIQRFGEVSFHPTIRAEQSWATLGTNTFSFAVFSATLRGRINIGTVGTTTVRVDGAVARGKLPTQRVFNLPGSIPYDAVSNRFRTLDFREFGGDRKVTAFIEHDFGDQLFRWVPFLKGRGLRLIAFGGAGWTTMTNETRLLQQVSVLEAKTPFYEAGFALGKILTLFRIDLAWRLNHLREERGFFAGISTPLLD